MASPFDPLRALLIAAGLADDIVTWPQIETAIVADTNAARRRQRRAALSWDADVADVARRHAADMLRHRYFDHKSRDGRGIGDRLKRAGVRWQRCGENLYGQPTLSRFDDRQMRAFGAAAVVTWLRSRGHRQNLLAAQFVRVGVGVVASSNHVIAVQVFVA